MYQDISLKRHEVIHLDDNEILYHYDNLCETYLWDSCGFNRDDIRDNEKPAYHYVRLMRRLLDVQLGAPIKRKIKIATIIYKVNIVYHRIFNYEAFSNRYKNTAVNKAHELLQDPKVMENLKLKRVLEYFLTLVG
jgi:hypothetical protein